jgi:hypothetical protein
VAEVQDHVLGQRVVTVCVGHRVHQVQDALDRRGVEVPEPDGLGRGQVSTFSSSVTVRLGGLTNL